MKPKKSKQDLVQTLNSFVIQHRESGKIVEKALAKFSDENLFEEHNLQMVMPFLTGYRGFTSNIYFGTKRFLNSPDKLHLAMTIEGINDYCEARDIVELWETADYILLSIAAEDKGLEDTIHNAVVHREEIQKLNTPKY